MPTATPAEGTHHAFGLSLRFGEGVVAEEIPEGAAGLAPATFVRLAEAGEVDGSWDGAGTTTREMVEAGHVTMRVEHSAASGYLLSVPAWGRFLVPGDGLEVLCEPGSDAWQRALAAQVLPLTATVRGLEPFHASGVVLGGRALMLSAAPRTGKTTLAAHLVARGAQLLTDDVLVLTDDGGVVRGHPGTRWLHLRADQAEALRASSGLTPAGERHGRQVFDAPVAPADLPLAAVYLLERAGGEPAIEPLEPVPPTALLASTYNLSVHEPHRLRRQLDLCALIAATVPAFRVVVPQDTDPGTLAGRIAEHAAALEEPRR